MAPGGASWEARRKQQAQKRELLWRGLLAEWSRSGLSQAAFCRERGIRKGTFQWWKEELGRRDAVRKGRMVAKGVRLGVGGAAAGEGAFRFPHVEGERVEVEAGELMLLLEGIELAGARRRPRFVPRAVEAV